MRAIVLFFLISGMLTACGGSSNADKKNMISTKKLQIVSSIKPIQAIVLAIAGEHAQTEQLIPDYANPHDYSFKPSDIRKVKNADVVFRIDEHMETQLNGVFQNLKSDTVSIISLAQGNGIKLLEAGHSHHEEEDASKQHEHDDHQYDNHEKEEQHDEHQNKSDHAGHSEHNNLDFHIWTSPKNAVLMANQVAKKLSELDAKNATSYQHNIESFYEKVKAESEKIVLKLTPLKHKPYIVFHNSWQYFADEFGLPKPIVVDLHEGVSSGAKTVSEIRERIEKDNIKCIFYDFSISEARLETITDKANTNTIDVLAKGMELNQDTYIHWLKQLGSQIESCLSR